LFRWREHGYLIYYLKPGYFANTYRSNWYGNGEAPEEYNRYLFKMQDEASAQIEDFTVTDTSIKIGETITISADILPVMLYDEETRYIPEELVEDYYSDKVKIGLKIINKQTGALYMRVINEKIKWSTEHEAEFTWTPTREGEYTIQIITGIIDNKFLNTKYEVTQKIEVTVKGTQDPDDNDDEDKDNKYPIGFRDLRELDTWEDDEYYNQYDSVSNQLNDENLEDKDSNWEWYLSGVIILIVLILIIIGLILGRE